MFKDLQREMHLSIVTRVLSCPFSDNMVITIVYIVLPLKSQSVIKDGYWLYIEMRAATYDWHAGRTCFCKSFEMKDF